MATSETGRWLTRAAELSTPGGNYVIQNWQLEQGLPQISVTSIAQTSDGYLWLGTFNGLARFDGVRFQVFNEGSTPALGNSGITHLNVDAHGALWVLTGAGRLVRMAGGQFTPVLNENAHILLSSVAPGNEANDGLILLDRTGNWREITNGQLLPLSSRFITNETPRILLENGCLSWVAQHGRINRPAVDTNLVFVAEANGTNRFDLRVHSVVPSLRGGWWLGATNGLYRMRPGEPARRVGPLPGNTNLPFVLQEDGEGVLWAVQWAQGVFQLKPDGSWQHFAAGTGLADNFANCLFRDREGSLWVGTGQGGIHRFRRRLVHMSGTPKGSVSDVVTSVTEDRQGRLWFGVNGGGLHVWKDGALMPVAEPVSARSYALVYSVLADQQDAIWVGLYGKTVLRFSAGVLTPFDLSRESSQAMTPYALFEDRAGILWLGCTHGLVRFEQGQLRRYTTRDGLSNETVVALAEDREGVLYLGTDGGGLNSLRQGQFTSYQERDGLADNHVNALYVDRENALWIGTVNGGINRWRDGRFVTIDARDGLPSNTIASFLEDDLGNLWLGSNRGLIRINLKALNAYADGDLRQPLAWNLFGASDGLSTVGCTGAGQPRSWKARDGKLWFATLKGAAMVDANHLPFNPLPPPVVIERVVMDERGRELAGSEASVTVQPQTQHLEFQFTGLSLAAPEKTQFRFRLDPFDRNWMEAGTRRTAHYTGVNPGKYQFRVTACNNDGVWNEAGAALAVIVMPPWWMTWWFRTFVLVSAAGLLVAWHETRVRRVRREHLAQENFSRQLIATQESERQRIAGELHDGLGQDLLVIANQIRLTLRKEQLPPGATTRLNSIAETAKNAVQQARIMAHQLRPGLLQELGLTKAVRANLDQVAESSGLTITADLAEVDGLLPPEFEVSLFRILQESLNNILKHAAATQVSVTLARERAGLRLVVEDNGRGFDAARFQAAPPEGRGLGLHQITERAEIMRGCAEVSSQPGRGTRWTVTVPLPAPETS